MPKAVETDFSYLNKAKADFKSIYVQPDPRDYFALLGGLHYMIPDVAHPIFEQVIAHLSRRLGRTATVLDVGCSYGVNAALLKYGIGVDALRQRYACAGLATCPSARLAAHDRHFFASWPVRSDVRIVGLDVSKPATDYGVSVGLLDDAIVADLEKGELSASDARKVRQADLIISTGCVGYVSERTFERLIGLFPAGTAPWVASFVLRMFPYGKIEEMLANHALATEKLTGATFVQRRFRDNAESEEAQANIRALGLDPTGKESDGLYHAEFFLTRPQLEVTRGPLGEIVSVASGAGRLANYNIPSCPERRDAAA
jgi:hypothetical protein